MGIADNRNQQGGAKARGQRASTRDVAEEPAEPPVLVPGQPTSQIVAPAAQESPIRAPEAETPTPTKTKASGKGKAAAKSAPKLDVDSMSVAQVLAHLEKHPKDRTKIIAAEKRGKARTTLLSQLEKG